MHVVSADHESRMTTDAESKVMTLKERLDQGQYNVDAKKVADAIVRNPLWVLLFASIERPSADSRPAVG
jgi:Anti-sigma-28 factor, FlgM